MEVKMDKYDYGTRFYGKMEDKISERLSSGYDLLTSFTDYKQHDVYFVWTKDK